jgi:hypothetical protein
MNDKSMILMLAAMTMEILSKLIDSIPQRAKAAGMDEKEFFENQIGKEVAWAQIKDIAEDLEQLPMGMEGREELFELYEKIIEKIEKYN